MEQADVERNNDGDKDFWDRHVLLSQEYKGTDNKYCRELPRLGSGVYADKLSFY